MKLASLKGDQRDGVLVVVDQAIQYAVKVPLIARTMQAALENWDSVEENLKGIYDQLNRDEIKNGLFTIELQDLAAPLPRAYQWADASAYVNHVELVRKARGAEIPDSFWTDPLMYQGSSDQFLGATDPICLESTDWGIDFEAEIGILTDDVPMGITEKNASRHIKLLVLLNDISLRNLIPHELAKGFGFFQSKPTTSFSPVAITPDELGDAWKNNKVHLPLISHLNEKPFGKPDAGVDMTFDFARLIAHAAKSRHLSAGTIIGSGTVSNKDRSKGSSCIAEKRMLETINTGRPETPFMKFGDRIQIQMLDKNGHNLFGSIDQIVTRYDPPV